MVRGAQSGSIAYAFETLLFFDAIRSAWCRETSADPEAWSDDNPAWGQCAVTALIVQDGLGGDLLRSTVGGVSHYWNRVNGGMEIDLTRGQFGPDANPDAPPIIRPRSYLTDSTELMPRYALLLRRVLGPWRTG